MLAWGTFLNPLHEAFKLLLGRNGMLWQCKPLIQLNPFLGQSSLFCQFINLFDLSLSLQVLWFSCILHGTVFVGRVVRFSLFLGNGHRGGGIFIFFHIKLFVVAVYIWIFIQLQNWSFQFELRSLVVPLSPPLQEWVLLDEELLVDCLLLFRIKPVVYQSCGRIPIGLPWQLRTQGHLSLLRCVLLCEIVQEVDGTRLVWVRVVADPFRAHWFHKCFNFLSIWMWAVASSVEVLKLDLVFVLPGCE